MLDVGPECEHFSDDSVAFAFGLGVAPLAARERVGVIPHRALVSGLFVVLLQQECVTDGVQTSVAIQHVRAV